VIEGASIRLRSWQESDVAAMAVLRNSVDLQAQLLARARGSDDAQVHRWLQDRSSGIDSLLFIIANRQSNSALGYMQFAGLDPIDRRAELGICIAPAAQGQGLGKEAIALALPYLRDTWGLRKLSLRVRSDNQRAIRCYLGLQFEQCGLLRQHVFISGGWHDVVLMERFLVPDSETPCVS
jgi:diamine N-acetyltransferase